MNWKIGVLGAVRWDADAGVFVSYAPQFGVYSQGLTEDDAFESLESALALFIGVCLKKGSLDRALSRRGLVPVKQDVREALKTFEASISKTGSEYTRTTEVEAKLALA
jgi:predicted RNase H-like HicB family nuclease